MNAPRSPFLTAEHEAFRDTMRRFVREEIAPFATEWDEAGTFPRELYTKAAKVGLWGLGFPEEYGGIDADVFSASSPPRNCRRRVAAASAPAWGRTP